MSWDNELQQLIWRARDRGIEIGEIQDVVQQALDTWEPLSPPYDWARQGLTEAERKSDDA